MRYRYLWWVLATVILLLSLGLRFYRLGELPSGLYWDEIAMLVDAKSVATSGQDMHGQPWYQVLYASYGDYKLPVYIWLASASVKLFGVSEWALRLPSAVAGVLTVLVSGLIAYHLARNQKTKAVPVSQTWFPTAEALLTMLIIAISPWDVMFSRTAFEGHVGQLLVAISVWLMLNSKKHWWGLYLAAAVGGLATYTYFSVRFVWPVLLVAYGWLLEFPQWRHWWRSRSWRDMTLTVVTRLIGPLLMFGVLLLPMMNSPLYEASNQFRLGTDSVLKNEAQVLQSNVYREIAGNTRVDRIVFHRYWLTARELFQNYADHLSLNYLFMTGDPNLRHGTGHHGLFLLVSLPLFLSGLYALFDRHKRILSFLLLWWLIALLPASVPENTPHALRSLNALVPLAVLMGWGGAAMVETVKRQRWLTGIKVGLVAVGAGLIFVNAFGFWYHYVKVYPIDSASAWQHGYREVTEAIFAMREGGPVYVHGFDDKYYLWVMGYGPYNGHDFGDWSSFSYQFRAFDGIEFSPFPGWDQVPNQNSRVLIAGRKEPILEAIEKYALVPVDTQEVLNPEGNSEFLVVLVDKQL